jgi:hypothetical protein
MKKPDPSTEEGMAQIREILKRREKEAEDTRKRSEKDIDIEPSGKLTTPNEIDLHRDRNDD